MFGLSNIACHSEQINDHFIKHNVFTTVQRQLVSSDLNLRREAIFTVGNALITMDIVKLHQMVTTGAIDIHGYLKGLTVLTSCDLLLSILQTIELFI